MRFTLEEIAIFSPSEHRLTGMDGSVAELTENNRRFLLLLLNGVTAKEKIMHAVWKEQRGVISESSYYGQLYMLRNAFSRVGLHKSLIRTIPRKGVQYVGRIQRMLSDEEGIAEVSRTRAAAQKSCGAQERDMTADNVVLASASTMAGRWFSQPMAKLIAMLMVVNLSWMAVLTLLVLQRG